MVALAGTVFRSEVVMRCVESQTNFDPDSERRYRKDQKDALLADISLIGRQVGQEAFLNDSSMASGENAESHNCNVWKEFADDLERIYNMSLQPSKPGATGNDVPADENVSSNLPVMDVSMEASQSPRSQHAVADDTQRNKVVTEIMHDNEFRALFPDLKPGEFKISTTGKETQVGAKISAPHVRMPAVIEEESSGNSDDKEESVSAVRDADRLAGKPSGTRVGADISTRDLLSRTDSGRPILPDAYPSKRGVGEVDGSCERISPKSIENSKSDDVRRSRDPGGKRRAGSDHILSSPTDQRSLGEWAGAHEKDKRLRVVGTLVRIKNDFGFLNSTNFEGDLFCHIARWRLSSVKRFIDKAGSSTPKFSESATDRQALVSWIAERVPVQAKFRILVDEKKRDKFLASDVELFDTSEEPHCRHEYPLLKNGAPTKNNSSGLSKDKGSGVATTRQGKGAGESVTISQGSNGNVAEDFSQLWSEWVSNNSCNPHAESDSDGESGNKPLGPAEEALALLRGDLSDVVAEDAANKASPDNRSSGASSADEDEACALRITDSGSENDKQNKDARSERNISAAKPEDGETGRESLETDGSSGRTNYNAFSSSSRAHNFLNPVSRQNAPPHKMKRKSDSGVKSSGEKGKGKSGKKTAKKTK